MTTNVACVVLHNLLKQKNDEMPQDEENITDDELFNEVLVNPVRQTGSATRMRLIQYFQNANNR